MYNEHEQGCVKYPGKEESEDETRIPNERPLGWAMEGGEGMAEGHERPGVMLYYEFARVMKNMTYEEKGRFIEAIMDYAMDGTEPRLKGGLKMFWPMVQDKIDRDVASYGRVVEGRKRAINTRWWKRYAEQNGIDPNNEEAREKWLSEKMGKESEEQAPAEDAEQEEAENTNVSFVSAPIRKIPTTTGTTTVTTTGTTSLTITGTGTRTTCPSVAPAPSVPPPACAGETPTHTQTEKEWYGEYGNVRLSPAEVNALRRELGDGWEGMVNRLSEYMRMHGKSYSDHYAAVRSFARNSRNTTEKERETLSDKSDQYTDCFPGSVL